MTIEVTVTVAIASFLLSLSGVSFAAGGDYIYLSNARRAVQVQIGIFDWVNFFLLDFFYIFAMWTFVAVRGNQLSTRRYLELGCVGFLVVFFGNAVKVFAEVYTAATSGGLSPGSDAATLASLDAIGFMVMFGIVFLAVGSTCLALAKGNTWRLGWPFHSNPSKTL